jgi:hypothetical protein
MIELSLLGGALLISLGILGIYISREDEQKTSLGTTIVPNDVFSVSDTSKAINIFFESWINSNPTHRSKLKRALGKLTLEWHSRKIIHQDKEVLALMEKPTHIHLWIGPKLKNGNRSFLYTGLFDQLSKLALLSNGLEPNTNTPEIKKILFQVRSKL